MWDLTVPGNNDHDFYVLVVRTSSEESSDAGSGGTPVLVHNTNGCELFDNKMAGTLDQELAIARQLGVKPTVAGSNGFHAVINSGTIKWAVLQDGNSSWCLSL